MFSNSSSRLTCCLVWLSCLVLFVWKMVTGYDDDEHPCTFDVSHQLDFRLTPVLSKEDKDKDNRY